MMSDRSFQRLLLLCGVIFLLLGVLLWLVMHYKW